MYQVARLISGPAVFALLVWVLPLEDKALYMLASMGWMLVWWAIQVVPIGITALLPMILFPMLGIDSLKQVSSHYANPIIYLFLGGFILGISIEKWKLHERLALIILKRSGTNPQRIIFGFMLATAILSIWISNTAAAMMMLPIGMSLISSVKPQFGDNATHNRFAVSLLLGLAFAANIGGMATLIGTPPNLVLAALANERLDIEIGFATWMVFALPLTAILFCLVLLVNTKLLFRLPKGKLIGLDLIVQERLTGLGKPSFGERMVGLVFFGTALLWVLRAPIASLPGMEWLRDTTIALIAAVSLFILPGGGGKPLLDWKDTSALPWEILLLFGGGISLAAGLESAGVVLMLGESLSKLDFLPWFSVLFIVTFITIFLTEGMSNVALVSVFAPLALTIAPVLGGAPLDLAVPLTLAASCAFMLPIATPPNAIVFGSDLIKVSQMMRSGLVLNILSSITIAVYCYYLVAYFFPPV